MKWKNKAFVMRLCANVPYGDRLYHKLQRSFGRLNADPRSRLPHQIEMMKWILQQNQQVEDKSFFEVGTGHKPIVPIGFFLADAAEVITVDLHRRIDWELTQRSLGWIAQNRIVVESLYDGIVNQDTLSRRLSLIERTWSRPDDFLRDANIRYFAPADAARIDLPNASVDYHLSVTTLEHIPRNVISDIFREAIRILRPQGKAIHFIDPSDHFQHQDKSISTVNFLRFTKAEWERIAGNEFAYCNRLRSSDYVALFDELGFVTTHKEIFIDPRALTLVKDGFPLDLSFDSYAPEDICTQTFKIMLSVS